MIRIVVLATCLATPAVAAPTYAPCSAPATDPAEVTQAFVDAGWTPVTGEAVQPLFDRISLANYLMLLYPEEPTTRAELDSLLADALAWGGAAGPDPLFSRGDDVALVLAFPKDGGLDLVCTFVGPAFAEVAEAVATRTPDFQSNGVTLYNLPNPSPDIVWSALRYDPAFTAPETLQARDVLLVSYNAAGTP